MAKLDFKGLIPGKKYKIVIHPNTPYGELKALPTIDFIVPEAPPRARNFRLGVKTSYTRKFTTSKKGRKLKIWKYKISQPSQGGPKYAVLITGGSKFERNKVKTGDKVTVTSALGTGFTATKVAVKNTSSTPKNRIRYLATDQGVSTTNWQLYSADDSGTRIVTVYGTTEIKIPTVKLRIPKAIYQNLMWNDTVKDFVHIMYRTGKTKASLSGPRQYFVDDTTVDRTTPKPISAGWDINNYLDGHPPVFTKEITDTRYYQFDFVVVRYVRYKNDDGSYTSWQANWIEQNLPFNKIISKPIGWKV